MLKDIERELCCPRIAVANLARVLQVKQYVQEVSWLLKFQTDTDHGYAGLDGLHTSEYPIVRSRPLCFVCAILRGTCVHDADLYKDPDLFCWRCSWAFGRLSADLPRLDAWNSRGTAPAQPDSIGAARIPGVSPFMQTLAYRTRGFLSNRFRCNRQHITTLGTPCTARAQCIPHAVSGMCCAVASQHLHRLSFRAWYAATHSLAMAVPR